MRKVSSRTRPDSASMTPPVALSRLLNSPSDSSSGASAVFSGQLSSQSSLSSLSPTSPQDYRQKCHPRRTRPRPACAPPSLQRQSERKTTFVDSLVGECFNPESKADLDTTTQMVQIIWPSSAFVRVTESVDRRSSRLDLRFFIQEVLRRSKTSYSTLQVALYYLILVRCSSRTAHVDSEKAFSLQCGRRMFITALILASKYLQDRNFSTNAWSKISGLSTWDLNVNERAFLAAVGWNLHLPAAKFHRWTEIVLRYSPSARIGSPAYSWKDVVTRITPELDNIELTDEYSDDSGYDSDLSPPCSIFEGEDPAESSPPKPSQKPTFTTPAAPSLAPLPTPAAASLAPLSTPAASSLAPMPTPAAASLAPLSTPAAASLAPMPISGSSAEILAPVPVRRASCRFLEDRCARSVSAGPFCSSRAVSTPDFKVRGGLQTISTTDSNVRKRPRPNSYSTLACSASHRSHSPSAAASLSLKRDLLNPSRPRRSRLASAPLLAAVQDPADVHVEGGNPHAHGDGPVKRNRLVSWHTDL